MMKENDVRTGLISKLFQLRCSGSDCTSSCHWLPFYFVQFSFSIECPEIKLYVL